MVSKFIVIVLTIFQRLKHMNKNDVEKLLKQHFPWICLLPTGYSKELLKNRYCISTSIYTFETFKDEVEFRIDRHAPTHAIIEEYNSTPGEFYINFFNFLKEIILW